MTIAGHRDTVFRKLRFVRLNQLISLTTVHEEIPYRVVSLDVVSPSDVRVLYPTSRDTVTLITCYPFNFIGAAPKRLISTPGTHRCRPECGKQPG